MLRSLLQSIAFNVHYDSALWLWSSTLWLLYNQVKQKTINASEQPATVCVTDIDECQDDSVCIHGHCQNTEGSFICNCEPGFILSSTGEQCNGTRVHVCVIFYHVFILRASGIDSVCNVEIFWCLQMWTSVWSYIRPVMVWGSASISWDLTSAAAHRDIDKLTAPAAKVRINHTNPHIQMMCTRIVYYLTTLTVCTIYTIYKMHFVNILCV